MTEEVKAPEQFGWLVVTKQKGGYGTLFKKFYEYDTTHCPLYNDGTWKPKHCEHYQFWHKDQILVSVEPLFKFQPNESEQIAYLEKKVKHLQNTIAAMEEAVKDSVVTMLHRIGVDERSLVNEESYGNRG